MNFRALLWPCALAATAGATCVALNVHAHAVSSTLTHTHTHTMSKPGQEAVAARSAAPVVFAATRQVRSQGNLTVSGIMAKLRKTGGQLQLLQSELEKFVNRKRPNYLQEGDCIELLDGDPNFGKATKQDSSSKILRVFSLVQFRPDIIHTSVNIYICVYIYIYIYICICTCVTRTGTHTHTRPRPRLRPHPHTHKPTHTCALA